MRTESLLHSGEPFEQTDLFATPASEPGIDVDFTTARRHQLDADSWVEVVPGWLSAAGPLLDSLIDKVRWEQRNRRLFDQTFVEPRLTGEYPDLREVPDPLLIEAARALSAHYGLTYDGLWINFYRDGQDSTGWHRDFFSPRPPETIVPVLTLGATRRFLIKPRAGGKSVAFRPRSGDLVVMGGRAQEDWVHGVPKDPAVAGPRVSVNFQCSRPDSSGFFVSSMSEP